jgi:hypothetical protein
MPKNPHRSGATMIVDRYDPVNLFELVPKLNLQFEPQLAHLDRLLDDDELFNDVVIQPSPQRSSERIPSRGSSALAALASSRAL